MATLIHTADWQLGKPFRQAPEAARAALWEARLDSIDAIGALARETGAEHVLAAGDVFDNFEPGDRVISQALGRMSRAPCRWWLLPGNHDFARAEGLWGRLGREAPANVTALTEPAATHIGDNLWLLPAPLAFRRTAGDPTIVLDAMETPAGARRIGLAHGPVKDFGDSQAMNLIDPERPRKAGLDYLALGDWHGFQMIGEHAAYSGTPEPDDFGRSVTGGAVVVELGGPGAPPHVTHRPLARFTWLQETWALDGPAALDEAIGRLDAAHDLSRLVLRLKVEGVLGLADLVRVREDLGSRLADSVRWLDLQDHDLLARPGEDDLAEIDAHGVLRVAAERLKVLADGGGEEKRRAGAALERLFLETIKARRGTGEAW